MPPIPVQCMQCSELFRSQASFDETHGNETGHTSTFVCLECFETFPNHKARREHMTDTKHKSPLGIWTALAASRGMAGPVTADYESTSSQEDEDLRNEGDEASTCKTCRTPFQSKSALADHLNSTLSCPTCQVCLDPSQTLQDHFWDAHGHPKCRPCALGFADQAELLLHQAHCPVAPTRAAGKQPAGNVTRNPQKDINSPPSPQNKQSTPPISMARVSGAASNAGSLATSSKSTYTTCGDQTDRSSPGSDYAMSSDGSNTDIGERMRSASSSSVEVTPTIARRAFSVTPPRSPNTRPRGSPTTSATALSWHCRSCMRNPCHEPIATACGHIFCRACFLRELKSNMCCPVCKKAYLIQLHVELDI